MKIFSLFKEEEGMVLITSMLIMGLLTLLGTAAIITSTIDTKIATNYKDGIQAQYAAEAGIEKVWDALMRGNNAISALNDLDNNGTGTIDFTQIYTNGTNVPSGALLNNNIRITVNSNTSNQADIWIDASSAPSLVTVYSRGNPAGTKARKEVAISIVSVAGDSLIKGALNNAAP